MGLTLFSYVSALGLFLIANYRIYKSPNKTANTILFLLSLSLAFSSIFLSLSYDIATFLYSSPALLFARLFFIFGFAASLILFRLSLTYPFDKKLPKTNFCLILLFVTVIYFVLFTNEIVIKVLKIQNLLYYDFGPLFYGFIGLLLAFFVASILVFLIRTLRFTSRIWQLQNTLIILELLACGLALVSLIYIFPYFFSIRWIYPLTGILFFLLLLSITRTLGITRLFDPGYFALRMSGMFFFYVLLGIPVTFSVLYILDQYNFIKFWVYVLIPITFLFWTLIGIILQKNIFKVIQKQADYSKVLDKKLSELDYTVPRHEFLEQLNEIFFNAFKNSTLDILVEKETGTLETDYSTQKNKVKINANEVGLELAINLKLTIIAITEIVSNNEFAPVKDQLLQLFGTLKAELIVIATEGRSVIALYAFGQKKDGSDYTTYDFEALERIYGKLFGISFYLKNIARESIISTVDREIELAGQIIQSVTKNIDPVTNPKLELGYISESTRKLGGDFIDFIRLGEERWFFVIGDIAGKGLNASMSMVILKSIIHTFLKEEKDFTKLVIKLNTFIKNHLPKGAFFAGLFGILDFKQNNMYFLNCGIPLMFLYSKSLNTIVEIQGDGKVLGFVKNIAPFLKPRKIPMSPDTLLFICTDGILESESLRGERYGKDRIQRAIMEYKNYPADKITALTFKSLTDFIQGEIADDVTLLTMKFKSQSAKTE